MGKRLVLWMARGNPSCHGFRIALIGLITPGLPYWLPPELLDGAQVTDPVPALRVAVAGARANKADAIVVAGHMGYRDRDDFANPLREMLKQVPGVDVYLAGHSHQNQPSWQFEKVLCSQAAYHGIYCGRVDLTFDRDTRKLVGKNALTELMDDRYAQDSAVMDLAAPDIRTASEQLARKVAEARSIIPAGGADNPLATLFCECFAEALAKNDRSVDGVFHGTFRSGDLPAGTVTVADCWKMLPYENWLVTAKLGPQDLIEIIKIERSSRGSDRILWPFKLRLDASGTVESFTHHGQPVAEGSRYTIAFNSYDAQSGGQSMLRLHEILNRPEAKRNFTGIEARNALIDGLLRRKVIGG
jgi:5'-nucleotidase / UDP-sugar diphosphatase